MKDKKEKLAEIFSTMKKKTKSDILAEFEEELVAAKNDGKTWNQLLLGLEQIGVTVSEKTLTNFLKDKVENIRKKNKKIAVKNAEKKYKKTHSQKTERQEHVPMPLFEK